MPPTSNDKPHPSVEDFMTNKLGRWDEIETAALDGLRGEAPREFENPGSFLHGLLRWVVSDRGPARFQWESLARNSDDLPDRDTYLVCLWRRIRTSEERPFKEFRAVIDEQWGALAVYERDLFEWLVRRFDFSGALGLVAGRRAGAWVNWFLAGAVILVVGITLAGFGFGLESTLIALLASCLVALIARPLAGVPRFAYVQALIPRLGATVAIGYLFLTAAPELVGAVVAWGRPAVVQWVAVAALLGAVWIYLVLHIIRRVHPAPPGLQLVRRSAEVMLVAAGYAALGMAVFGPFLFSENLLGPGAPLATAPGSLPPIHTLFLCAAVALGLGVLLQLAWEENPLTQPL